MRFRKKGCVVIQGGPVVVWIAQASVCHGDQKVVGRKVDCEKVQLDRWTWRCEEWAREDWTASFQLWVGWWSQLVGYWCSCLQVALRLLEHASFV